MSLASWTKVEAEAARMSRGDLKSIAARSNIDEFVWKAPHLETDVGKQPIDANAMAAMQAFAEEKWTPDLVDHWLSKPKDFLPGTSMFFDGIANENERRDLIGFLLIESRK